MTREEITELEAIESKATDGPWPITEGLDWDEAWCKWHKVGPFQLMDDTADDNDRFISTARDAMPKLIKRIKELEGWE